MALIDALHMATRAMDAQRSGIEVAGHNISNVNTPGYARRVLDLRPSAPLTAGSAGSGVDAIGVRALRDVFIERRLLQALPSEAREAAIADGLAVVEALLGAPGGSIDGALTQFFDAFAGLAADPTSPAARQDVISRAQSLANAFATLSTQLNAARQDADLSIRDGMDEVNRLAANIAELNQSIAQTSEPSTKAFFRDRQQAEVDRLAELIDISTMARGDGGIDITFGNGRSLVIGANPHLLSAIPSPPNGLVAIQNDGATVTSEITSGRVGGALQVRDVLLPDYLTRLDTLAFEVVEEVNALHTAGFDLDGNAAGVFFTALGATAGAAGAMALDPTLAANGRLVAAATVAQPGDNQMARAIANLRDSRVLDGGTSTLHDGFASLVRKVGGDSRTAKLERNAAQDLVTQVENLRDSASGVSLDEEAVMMLKFQRAFEANARFFQVIDEMTEFLIQRLGA